MDIFMRLLRALIRQMQIEPPPNRSFLSAFLVEQRNRALRVQAAEAMQLIRELQDSLSKVEYSDNWPLLRVLIAFCYCPLNDLHSARLWAEDAVRILKATNREMNLALAYWFLGEIYNQEGYFKDSREQFINAQNAFQQISSTTLNSNAGYKIKKTCSRRIRYIQRRINGISSNSSRLLDSARKDQKINVSPEDRDTASARADDHTSGGNVLNAPINVNIHIPIDNRSADHFDQRSLQYTDIKQDQFTNQDQESLLGTSIPVGIDFTNVTKQPGVMAPKPLDGKKPTDGDDEAPLPVDLPEFGYLMTPSLPIYGSATAGPKGEIFLDEPDYNAAIDESDFIRIDGGEYQVYSLRKDRKAVNIAYTDFLTSITPRKNRKIGARAHGWLQVIGNSMNRAQPININEGDHVLFFEYQNVDLIASKGKIVIVAESVPGSGSSQLLVKRLVNENNQWLLRSYSSENDPKNELPYEDLVYDDCYTLIGEVIAVAKPRPTEET